MKIVEKVGTISKAGLKVFYRINSADENVIRHSFENDIYLPVINHLKFVEDDIILDIGAHIGTFSMMLSKVNHNKIKIHCFEAAKDTYEMLKTNIEENRFQNINIYNLAITGDDADTKHLYHDTEQGNWGHSVVYNFGGKSEEVKNFTLSKLIKKEKLEDIKLIKFNCEGSEVGIIMNTSIKHLNRISNMILLYHFDLVNEYSLIDLKQKLKKAGFTFYNLKKEKNRGWLVCTREHGKEIIYSNFLKIIWNRIIYARSRLSQFISTR